MVANITAGCMTISDRASALFAHKRFDINALDGFFEKFNKPHFCHACAFPVQGGSAVDGYELVARLSTDMNGGEDIYMTAGDVDAALSALRQDRYKEEDDRGQSVTLYPALVEVLIQAKANLSVYRSTEMDEYLKRSFQARSGGDVSAENVKSSGVPYIKPV